MRSVLCALAASSGLWLGVQPALAGDLAAGRRVAQQCATCHGMDGIAQMPIAPNLAGENQTYLVTQLKAYRTGKREHEIMSIVAGSLSDQQIADVAAWYAAIQVTVTVPTLP
ncbi:MAG: cytochrome c [Pseudomonadota bacterium]